ncbi:MAG: macro domain-containing protein [Anaerolineae bacterium]|nr:macro domain-containing protein [Anaerolineae bacterium]
MSEIKAFYTFPGGQRLEVCYGDLTAEQTDAIVNAANAHLMHGGGIAAVIAQRGGATIERESRAWVAQHGPISHASPAFTGGGNLPCRYVIHAVGPVWGQGNEEIHLAESLGLHSIALPAISTGIFRFPVERAAGVFYAAISAYYHDKPASALNLTRLVLYDLPTLNTFLDGFNRWTSSLDR